MDRTTRSIIMTAPLVISDFDGTLAKLDVDWPALKGSLAGTAGRLGLSWDAGAGLDANLARIRRTGTEVVFRILCTLVARAEVRGFDPRRVNHPLVALLAGRGGAALGVFSSNTHHALRRCLAHACYRGVRPTVIGKEDVWAGKPDPEGLTRLCAIYGVLPEDAVFIGDAPGDRKAADAAGMPFIEAPTFSEQPAPPPDRGPAREAPSNAVTPKKPSADGAGERR